jgi:acetyl-CoA synthetase
MLPGKMPYNELIHSFRWQVPPSYNIGVDICDRWANTQPARIALIHKRQDGEVERFSYLDLKNNSNRLANLLRANGVERADRVALLLPQSPETCFGHIAIYKLGAITVPLASLFGVEALAFRLNNSGAKVVITNQQGSEKITAIRDQLTSVEQVFTIEGNAGADIKNLGEEMEKFEPEFEPVQTSPDDPALMVYTSGTTGPPKGALHGHRVLLGHLPGVQFHHDFFPQEGDLTWTPADWAWAGGLLNILLPSLHFGVPVLAYRFDKFSPQTAFELMEEFKVRNVFIPPTALKMLRIIDRPAQRYALNLRTIASGGEALGREVYDWARTELGITINEFYGQTECNIVLSSCQAIGISKAGAIGKPSPGHIVAVINEKGETLPPGETGTIAIKRPDPVMFLEYWNNPEATAQRYIGDWLTTGDQGMVDEEGYVSFIGRDDDVITSSGYRIGPGEIEDCLIGHEAVSLAAAVGKPDPLRTEIVKVFIVLKQGFTADDDMAQSIQAYVRQRLSAHEYPREIEFVDSLPLTTTGKVIRRLLRERA